MRSFMAGIFLIVFSTLCFYIPAEMFELSGFDITTVPERFYDYYSWMMAGAFALNITYATFLFYFIRTDNLLLKLPVCWLIIAETYTLIYHLINKIYLMNVSNKPGKIATIIIFIVCCSFFFHRAIFKRKSDKFYPEKTYIVRFVPKNYLGLLNHILTRSGHMGIYQDGYIYKFRKESSKVEKILFKSDNSMSFEEIERIENVRSVIGKEYSLLKYNCRHMVNDARNN